MSSKNEMIAVVSGTGASEVSIDLLAHKDLDPFFTSAPRSGVVSAWYGHVPFAYWIMTALRPRRFVELGTHNGVSYAAFCDAASRAGLDTRCFAVDTWLGDEHAGHYGENVYNDLREFHDARYAAFSDLIRSTFDQAREYFEDGTIDLLHIDGCHSYEAVRHDFDQWRSKLSSRAVVLFHDTNVRERHFGVWRLWAELQQSYPTFEFLHEHGLGVLALGSDVPDAVIELCNLSDPNDIARIRNRFAFSGRCCIIDSEIARERKEADGLRREIGGLRGEIGGLRGEIGALGDQIDGLRKEAAAEAARQAVVIDRAARQAEIQSREAEAEIRKAEAFATRLQTELDQFRVRLSEAESLRVAEAIEARARAEVQAVAEQARLHSIYASTSWQITAPLRRMALLLPGGIRRTLRRGLRVARWTVTLQLPQRLREYRALQQASLNTDASGPPPMGAPVQPRLSGQPALPVTTFPRAEALLRQHLWALEPLRVFPVTGQPRRVTIVTDDVGPRSLFGGVGTAIVLSTLLARRLDAQLRLVTRTVPGDAAAFAAILEANDVAWTGNVEVVHSPPGDGKDVPVGDEEIFVTTSWWTTRSVRGSIPPDRILYLLQEDERMFYPYGDERLRCAETLADPAIRFVVNTEMLFEHLVRGAEPLPNVAKRGAWFEPAFPAAAQVARAPRRADGRRNFFFYARPHNLRNLYWRGLEAIIASIEDGVLDPAIWDVYFVGRDLQDMELPGGIRPHLVQGLSWADYARLVGTMDVGLSLMDTPHPSYPPLDLALAGAVVVTNRHGAKTSLERYADDVFCVEPSVDGLRNGIREAVARAIDPTRRLGAVCLGTDWNATLEPALASLFTKERVL